MSPSPIPPHKIPRLMTLEHEVREMMQATTRKTSEAIRNRNARRAHDKEAAQKHQQEILAQQEQQRASKQQEQRARGQEPARQQMVIHQQLSPLDPNRGQMLSPNQPRSNLDGAAWSQESMAEGSAIAGAIPPNSSPLFVPMASTSDRPTSNAPVAPMQPSPRITNRHLDTPYEDTPHSPSQTQTHTPTPAQSHTPETQMSNSRKRKRDSAQSHPDISNIIKTLERVDQQQKLDIADRDNQILRLKLQLSDMQNVDLGVERTEGETMAQQSASMRSEIASLKKGKMDAEYKILELCDQLQAKDDDAIALDDWTHEKEELGQKVVNMEDQLQSAQQQVSRFMDAFHREAALRTEIKGKLDTQEKFNVKLSKDLKKKSDELKAELGGGSREKYASLSEAVRGLFGHRQMDAMSGAAFGDVGKALKRVKDLVMEGDEPNGGGNGK